MTDIILNVCALSMHFNARRQFAVKNSEPVKAVDNVTFEVFRGETFGVVGESGSGKTTLGRCIMRVLKPNAGTIEYTGNGQPPVELVGSSDAVMREIWRDIRMIFQDPQSSLNPRLPVIEIVGQALRKSENLSGRELADRVSILLQQVGLRSDIMHRYPGAFSGGQRQRLGIARALATNPQLVIADEAVSALDVSIQAQTLNLLQDLQEKFRLTYIFIAHDLAVVEHICDRVAVMYRGQIVELASTDTLFRNPMHPYTRELLSAVPVADPRNRRKRKTQNVTSEIHTSAVDIHTGCGFAQRCLHATDWCRTQVPESTQLNGTQVLCHFAGDI